MNLEKRDWLFDVLNCINKIDSSDFNLQEIYTFSDILQTKHPHNHNIEAKIRQQLQFLRNQGFIDFLGNGHYRKVSEKMWHFSLEDKKNNK